MPFLVDTLSMTLAQARPVGAVDHSSDPARAARRRRRHAIAACRDRNRTRRRRRTCTNPGSTCASIASAMRPIASSCSGGCWRRWPMCGAPAPTGCACATSVLQAVRRHQPPPAAAARRRDRREPRAAAVHGGAPLHVPRLSREPRCAARPQRAGAAAGPGQRARPAAPPSLPARATSGSASRQHPPRAALPELLIITKANHALDGASARLPRLHRRQALRRTRPRDRRGAHPRACGPRSAYARRSAPGAVAAPQAQARLEHFPFAANSHDGKRLSQIVQTLPRDELFQASVAGSDPLRTRGAGAAGSRARAPDPAAR